MNTSSKLPPGQYESKTFPRFGLTPFANRFPKNIVSVQLSIGGDVAIPIAIETELKSLKRVEQCSDFHCVTTWTHKSLVWGGYRFSDFYQNIVLPLAKPKTGVEFVVLRSQDGYRTTLPLEDLLAPDVLLADSLNGELLSISHGAPLRLVAPSHYGYKNVKHLKQIEFWCSDKNYQPIGFRFMDHPRARVAQEERGRWIPNIVLRYLYRPLVRSTVLKFERAMRNFNSREK
jgi:DMSO/TMAO reductase YedYZ molybdopterin-dependent catalytic subunit